MESFAIIRVNGKQYCATKGGRVVVDRLEGKEGSEIKLNDVLLTYSGSKTSVGTPAVKGVTVLARIVGHPRGPKGESFRYARKKRVRRLKGFRAALTELEILDLGL